jgi:hypothetical protein
MVECQSDLSCFFSLLFLFLLDFLFLFIHDHPIVLVVVLVPVALEQLFKHAPHRCVVRSFVKSNISCLTQILGELHWISLAQHFDRSCEFLLFNSFILVPFIISFHPLPWQHSSQEIHVHVSNAFHVISASLLNAQMGVD